MTTSSTFEVSLDSLASCFEGMIPATIGSCSSDGTPNVTFLSVVQVVDASHVGLSYQFFNKTKANVQQNPRAQVLVISPETMQQYRLDLRFERTETQGVVFERMKARLDAVASQTGTSHIFKLRGVDVYEVLQCRALDSRARAGSADRQDYLARIEEFTGRLTEGAGLEAILDGALQGLAELFGYEHCFVMVPDETCTRLFTIASRGFGASGVGSEVTIGEGLIGVAAERRQLVRTVNLARELLYLKAVAGARDEIGEKHEIALPGLAGVQSQIVAPLVSGKKLVGVMCMQSALPGGFRADDERVVRILAAHVATAMALHLRTETVEQSKSVSEAKQSDLTRGCSTLKHYRYDDSVFVDDAYLIKGIAGRILWKLLEIHARTGRVEFTNREIRLDTSLELPDIKDNLEARLILLRKRLGERCEFLQMQPAGRGRFRIDLRRKLELLEKG